MTNLLFSLGGLAGAGITLFCFLNAITYQPVKHIYRNESCPKEAEAPLGVMRFSGTASNWRQAYWWEFWRAQNGMIQEDEQHVNSCTAIKEYSNKKSPGIQLKGGSTMNEDGTLTLPPGGSIEIPVAITPKEKPNATRRR